MYVTKWKVITLLVGIVLAGILAALGTNWAVGEYRAYRQMQQTFGVVVQLLNQNLQAGKIEGLKPSAPSAPVAGAPPAGPPK